ncbi:MAG: hypothetical protein DDT19_01978 [Syntrophomonadaceae bacterium]|nr:hypothetical protein [Bacillota bacterium]
MSTIVANRFRFLLTQRLIHFGTDVFRMILMGPAFVFDRVIHRGYADVTAGELPTANGYTVGGVILAGVAITENNVAHRTEITWGNAVWTASGAGITARGAIIYNDTLVTAPHIRPIIQYIDFGGNQTAGAGGTFTVASPATFIG